MRFQPNMGRILAAAADNYVSLLDVETQVCRLKLQVGFEISLNSHILQIKFWKRRFPSGFICVILGQYIFGLNVVGSFVVLGQMIAR